MPYKFDLNQFIKDKNISSEWLAKQLNISYHDMSAMLRGIMEVPDWLIGRLYKTYGKTIFF